MHILFEDADVVVLDKPAGTPTIPDRFGSDSVKDRLERERGEKLWVVHRLDREVGGVLVFARNADAHRALSMAFEQHRVEKTYEAVTEGVPPEVASVRWENILLRGKKRSYASPHGKVAITDATCLGTTGQGWLRWSLRPLTGRNHQLRVHLSLAGYPIVGDALYGSTTLWPAGIALRAVRLSVPPLRDGGPSHLWEAAGP